MIAVACVMILGALAMPKLSGYVLEARLNGAKPYLMEIAAKQRMYKIETGKYCCSGATGLDENTLNSNLGLSLANAGDFCFAFICRDSTLCEATVTTSFISTTVAPTAQPEFEVWAILRDSTAASIAGPGGAMCTVMTTKQPPTGWVQPASLTSAAGRAGQAVALRFQPPQNGRTSSPTGSYHAVTFDWRDGMSLSDALSP